MHWSILTINSSINSIWYPCSLSMEGQYLRRIRDLLSWLMTLKLRQKLKFQNQWSFEICYHSFQKTFITSTLQSEKTTFVNTKVSFNWWTWRTLYPPLLNLLHLAIILTWIIVSELPSSKLTSSRLILLRPHIICSPFSRITLSHISWVLYWSGNTLLQKASC